MTQNHLIKYLESNLESRWLPVKMQSFSPGIPLTFHEGFAINLC